MEKLFSTRVLRSGALPSETKSLVQSITKVFYRKGGVNIQSLGFGDRSVPTSDNRVRIKVAKGMLGYVRLTLSRARDSLYKLKAGGEVGLIQKTYKKHIEMHAVFHCQ